MKKNCFKKCLKKNIRFETCYETKKTAVMFCSAKDSIPVREKKQKLSTKSLALVV